MRIAAELGLFLVIGVFLGVIGPYGTAHEPMLANYTFWLTNIVGGGLIGIAIETALRRWIRNEWKRAVATAATMTPPVTILVFGAMIVVLGHDHHIASGVFLNLLWQVFVISLAVMVLRMLVRRPPKRIVESRTIIAPPLPDAEAKLRSRLSAKRRSARLFAIEAHDHYVLVHTDAGVELIGLRFSDAVAELAGAHGFRVHRSWWVSAEAIKAARWRRGSGEVELENGLVVPVSRSGAPALRTAGWF
jgi:hypothetical protein